jgi:oligopeptidase B
MKTPSAKKIAKELVEHGHTRMDNYYWMRLSDEQKNAATPDEQTADVLAYLKEENDHVNEGMKHTEELQKLLFEEMKGRIKEDDSSVPVKQNGYWYYTRFEIGQDYAFNCRKKENMESGEEEILINGPEMGKGKDYWALGGLSISENNRFMVYGIDEISRRVYTLHVRNLETGEMFNEVIEGTSGSATWASDNLHFFYTKKDAQTLRDCQVWRHELGTDPSTDVLVFEEKDEEFSCFVFKTKTKKYLMIGSSQTVSDEYWVLESNNPKGEFRLFQKRERDLEYSITHYEDKFYVLTNLEAKNFRLMSCSLHSTEKESWEEVIPHRENTLLESVEMFKEFLVLEERTDGLAHIRVTRWDKAEEYYLEFPDPTYSAGVGANPEFDTETLRFGYSSMTTPGSVFDYNMKTRERELKKQQPVLGEFNASDYASERIFATAKDGVKVPISLVYKKGFQRNGSAPCLLYAYGSYGHSMDAGFSSARLSMLNRGFVFAIAHIRGGSDMGRNWYEEGKLLKKKNTFTDFIACGEFLVEEKYSTSDRLFAMGGSAGGLLMGAVANMAPSLFNGIISAVPFVDVVTTMLDESIPLTTFEFDEWGNPKDKAYYDYMLSYSPIDNIEAKDYPHTLVTTGYWDSQVQYWEPAKYVAKLREMKTDSNKLFFKCTMEAGHGGKSGRFEALKEVALEYAFLLDLAHKA